ncbi:MAG: MoaD/ThiS family protein [Promethearchaeota archaeon]|jgi:MoaD family protein
MIVKVLYFAEFKDITEKEKETFDLSKDNLKELIDLLMDKYNVANLIWDEKTQKVHNLISVIINNQPIHEKNPLLIKLKDGDTIAFLMPVSGG